MLTVSSFIIQLVESHIMLLLAAVDPSLLLVHTRPHLNLAGKEFQARFLVENKKMTSFVLKIVL